MSFSEQILNNKFDALEESQDSIVSTSQWVLFHYRYAERIANEWERYINKAPIPKKLPLLYICNEVVQQSRAKRKTEFIDAFQKILPRSLTQTYKEVPENLKKKIVKIVNIWKERRIFPKPIEIDGVAAVSSSSSSSKNGTPENTNASFDDKLKAVSNTGQKFQKLYHELLLKSNGVFKKDDIKNLNSLKKTINDNIIQLQDITESIENEVDEIHKRDKAVEEKRKEVEAKQKEIEDQKLKDEIKRIEEEAKRIEEERIREVEENMIPTYEEGSDSDSDSDAPKRKIDSDSDSEDEVEDKVKDEEKNKDNIDENKEIENKEEENDNDVNGKESTSEQPPTKKLRFAE
ncbi:Laminin subunit beta-4 [Wickerhamomyces ciferrii]|uniref:Laminin subunit beta-4 n=1 Tax=Wickerhamomyces ciferrii (strain ATCC 14091 / BCRC 22168 / CBS 111 / JCM 3599 / NBRC 0793 / NRRL Y-1031 F-60-10) TaxID=1206466 RepID=K0KQZ8_WICCF|nr:Laminin subunit beta-4 [Wickerhamomyces ciferrii]CCH44537.1 Laminin subunit beta-4 [Wickerhamomyces ciferrii]